MHGVVKMWYTMSRLEPDGTETCLIALHVGPPDLLGPQYVNVLLIDFLTGRITIFTSAVPSGGHIAIYALRQSPKPDTWPTANFSEVLSVPISISVSSLSMDTQTVSVVGLSADPSPVVSVLFINHINQKSFLLETGVEHHQNSALSIFVSRKEVGVYIEKGSMG
jgi:hypothetical protein